MLASLQAFAADAGHVVVRENVPTAKREELIKRLRTITGWTTLRFDQAGILQVGTEEASSGSPTARALLKEALNSNSFIVLEDASSRADVAFCRVVPARWLTANGSKLPALVVLIDFADFNQLLGDEKALAAFNVGWGLLHELDHVVSDSTDIDQAGLVGECESHINDMRREVGLPLRVEYFFRQSSLRSDPDFNRQLVRLAFEIYDPGKSRNRRYWVIWDATAAPIWFFRIATPRRKPVYSRPMPSYPAEESA